MGNIKTTIAYLASYKRKTFNPHFKKYIVNYQKAGEYIKVIANTGEYRIVKNTNKNIRKINQAIVKSKVEIAKRIDDYENKGRERVLVLLFNMLLLSGSGILIPLSFFTGIYLLFFFSIIAFSISVITTSLCSFDYYILVKEIQSLKRITGYKQEYEFKLSPSNIKILKSHN